MQTETFLKVVVILVMLILMLTLSSTAFITFDRAYNQNIMRYHVIAGVLVMTILPVHIYLRREKLKKLLKEFFSIVTTGGAKQPCTNHAHLKTFKQRSLRELCEGLNICIDSAGEFLDRKGIVIYNLEHTLEKIANDNKNDPLKIFALISENQIRIQKDDHV
ncbi:hypothetical protein [Sulfuricurvum sp.]|uniref:hypothetical protein n=1 Tax=Sulfuricurvum sp. TaxID=2025608 RepID=UPI002605270C|nr:hypothetical protein [Sulfuricurvum sp.]MDD2267268.1 hypothetical protein [Sulfuricurvum sp.]MDD2784406.1 hypothetical protein [Sulfuricurvum sp.]HZF70027.1 hypothetical protein [Sulfuricurvum sp.]